jgi:hypothetical protein
VIRRGYLLAGVAAAVALGVALLVDVAPGCGGSGEQACMEVVAHVSYDMGGDLQFQRRSGSHTIDGVSVDTTTDLVFASAHTDMSRVDGGIEVIDITDPSHPAALTRIPCPGYQSDVAVYETLLVQTLDHAGSNAGCDPEWLKTSGSAAVDRAGTGGVRIFDVTDPARPRLIHFVEVKGEIGDGVHDVTVLAWAGVAYLAQLNGELGILDLRDPAFPYTAIDVTSISPEMKTSCHDIGLDPVRLLAFCAANEDETYVLDVREPTRPGYLSRIVNAAMSRHHGALMAPDGVTLVLQSEYDHPPALASDAPAGLWFYDLSEPTAPELLGSWAPDTCAPTEQAERACSSHWFNFIPGSERLVVAWRHEGVFVVDYTNPTAPLETGFFSPSSRRPIALPLGPTSDFWTAYYWHGHVYASSGGSLSGLYILRDDDVTDAEPSPYDEGTSWGRWTAEGP